MTEKMEKWFKKEGYLVQEIAATKSVTVEYSYPADIPPFYPIMASRCYYCLRNYFIKQRLERDKRAVALELYYKDLKKVVIYAPVENFDLFAINNLQL